MDQPSIIICVNRRFSADKPSCAVRGSEELAEEVRRALVREELAVELKEVHCLGACEEGPNLRIAPGGRFFTHFSSDDIPQLIDELRAVATP